MLNETAENTSTTEAMCERGFSTSPSLTLWVTSLERTPQPLSEEWIPAQKLPAVSKDQAGGFQGNRILCNYSRFLSSAAFYSPPASIVG